MSKGNDYRLTTRSVRLSADYLGSTGSIALLRSSQRRACVAVRMLDELKFIGPGLGEMFSSKRSLLLKEFGRADQENRQRFGP